MKFGVSTILPLLAIQVVDKGFPALIGYMTRSLGSEDRLKLFQSKINTREVQKLAKGYQLPKNGVLEAFMNLVDDSYRKLCESKIIA
jgi:hypothetical protein